ncbi:MAG: hypothetical protein HFF01_09290 [Erysipelotrichaceae bacterium]|nr:hypothetical protein [Erysipelotrichaceae bacterium]MCI9525199.1 hypothetical protein [Erysipelotrichaceae bacterium]
MWKRILIVFIALFGTLSVGYAFYNAEMKASNQSYQVGGEVRGRVNMAPKGISGKHIGLQAGDHVMIGGDNPYTGKPLSFQLLLYDENYTDYNNTDVINVVREPISSWLTGSDEVVTEPYNTFPFSLEQVKAIYNKNVGATSGYKEVYIFTDYTKTVPYQKESDFNQYLQSNSETSLFAPRNLYLIRGAGESGSKYDVINVAHSSASAAILKTAKNMPAFMLYHKSPQFPSKLSGVMLGIEGNADYSVNLTYYSVDSQGKRKFAAPFIPGTGRFEYHSLGGNLDLNQIRDLSYRPFLYLDLSNIVFAIEPSENSDIRSDIDDTFEINTSAVYYSQGGESMKLRMLDPNLSATLTSITGKNSAQVTKIIKGGIVNLNGSGNPGDKHTMSALIFDTNDHLVGYQPLKNTQSGEHPYEFDTSKLKKGVYQISLVNEVYDDNSIDPTYSSLITEPLTLEIVDPVSITATPKTDLVYKKNANKGDIAATYTTKDGFDPITVTVISDTSVSGHSDDYQLFSLNNGNVIVNETNGLDAGDYYFKLHAIDANGDPTGGVDSSTVHVTVAKADPTIAFNTTTQTNKSIKDAGTGWSEPATATPSTGTKVTYTKTGGDIGLIDIDKDTGQITYKGNGAFGKVTIKATVDDDPATGKDNYNSAETTKEIVIYREVDGTLTPHSDSDDTTTPTFSMDQANVKTNGDIGTIKGILGTPDTIGGTTTTYSYAMKNEGDSSFFKVNSSTGVIQSNANLSVGSYHFKVTVSDKWSSKDISVTVNVGMAPAENLKFYENALSNVIITQKSVKLTDTNVVVYATVRGSSNNNLVTYKLKDGESTNIIDVHPNSGAITIKKVGTVVIIAEKQGENGQAVASAELTFTVTAGEQTLIYTDVSGNELPKTGDNYQEYVEVYAKDKTFQLYTSDGTSRKTRNASNVTYALKAGSPTDVISVDSNGLVHILNASLNTQKGKVIVEATKHDSSGNYADITIALPITITKADQKISFADVTNVQNGKGTVTPVISAQNISSNDGGVNLADTKYLISIDASIDSSIAWTSDGVNIQYNYTGEKDINIPLHVEKAGNRNYNKAEANGLMRILGPDESTLTINRPGKIEYGDHFVIQALQDDSSSTNVQYMFEVNNTVYVSNPKVNGNIAEFDALKNSGNTEIEIKVTRTADGEVTLSKTVKIKVLPKDIDIIIDDKKKQQGEENPKLTFQNFADQLVSWNGVKDSVDINDVTLRTTATKESKAGTYPITGNTKEMNTTYPNYNFIFKEGKLMVEGMVDKDVDGDGKPDFNDPDGDGCPDLNIKWKDDDGKWIVINGDRDYDGIPDLNIDADGDGKPDLNIDTDNDGLPDINLVILKKSDWTPVKCVTVSDIVKEEYCTGTNVKPQINVDTDNDNIPNINIDNKGDFKPHINISKDDKTPAVNIAIIHTWTPDKNYKKDQFTYDTMVIDEKKEVLVNIDTDGDGRADVNVDMNGDGKPDINIDTNHDWIPDINIDTKGDGLPDTNVDIDSDGTPDENIIEITEWKPNKDGNKDGFLFDTMEIKQKTELEDGGIKIEKTDGTPFLPNYALKVEDITDSKKEEITIDAKDFIKENQEVKKVFDVKLIKDNIEVQPDGILKVKIPYDKVTNPVLIRMNEDGTYERIDFKIEDGYLTYETDELGIISLIGDMEELESNVKGNYHQNIGGAITGDETNIYKHVAFLLLGIALLRYMMKRKQKDTFQ